MRDLASKAHPCLWDTSALSAYLGMPKEENIRLKLDYHTVKNETLEQFRSLLPESRFYVTEGVLREMQVVYDEIGRIKVPKQSNPARRDWLKLKRLAREGKRIFTGLVYDLQESERVVDFTQEKDYREAWHRCRFFLEKYGLSETNLDFLVSGFLLSRMNEAACLISNDFGILTARNVLIKREDLSDSSISFVIRQKDGFRLMEENNS